MLSLNLMAATLSFYIIKHLKRFRDYVLDLQNVPQPLESMMTLPDELMEKLDVECVNNNETVGGRN